MCTFESPYGVIDRLVGVVDLMFDGVDHGLFSLLPFFEQLLLQEKQPLHGWQVSQFQLVFPDLLEDMIYLGDDIITSFDVIVEWPMETVRSSVQELYTLLRSYLCYGVVGLFSWNVQLVVTH